MAENELSKYFSEKSTAVLPSGAVSFRRSPAAPVADSSNVPVCTLFQSSPPAALSDPSNFFDLLGTNISDLSLASNKGMELTHAENPVFESPRVFLPGRVSDLERTRAAWIPPESTRRILIAMVSSPPGTYTQDRENLTMPGIVLKEDMRDGVAEALTHYKGPQQDVQRNVLRAQDVTQDDRGLRSLIKAGCYRAAVNLTRQLLTIYGQGPDRAGHPSKHTVHSIQLWFTRLALLVKLRSAAVAEVEAEPFGDMDKPDLYFQFYPELYGGRMGSLVPFGFRLLVAQIPMYTEKYQVCLTSLHKILATVRKIIKNLENNLFEDGTPCDMNPANRAEALALWHNRETIVQHSIVNCALACKDYTLAIEVLMVLIDCQEEVSEKAVLHSALGRILLQLGDIIAAEKHFKVLRDYNKPETKFRCLIDSGLLLVADGKFKEALRIFETALEIDSSNIMVLNNMAVCLLYLGRLKDSIKVLENGLTAYPSLAFNENYLLNLANLYELHSPKCFDAKLNLLSLVSKYRGDNVNISCLKLRP